MTAYPSRLTSAAKSMMDMPLTHPWCRKLFLILSALIYFAGVVVRFLRCVSILIMFFPAHWTNASGKESVPLHFATDNIGIVAFDGMLNWFKWPDDAEV